MDTKRWWTKLDEDDPISLEPLAELAYPPFSLRNLPDLEPVPQQQASVVAGNVTHFDGRVLNA